MRPSIRPGVQLPESFEDFCTLVNAGGALYRSCIECKAYFGPGNTKTPVGWRETQISGFCEKCFDAIWVEGDDDYDEEDCRAKPF